MRAVLLAAATLALVFAAVTAVAVVRWPDSRIAAPAYEAKVAGSLPSVRHAAATADLSMPTPGGGRQRQEQGTPVARTVSLQLVAIGDCWVLARRGGSDGRTLFDGTVRRGSALRLHAPTLWIRLGAPAAVHAVLNGHRVRIPAAGMTLLATPAGVRALAPPVSSVSVAVSAPTESGTSSASALPASPPSSPGPASSSSSPSPSPSPGPEPEADPTPDP